MSQLLEALLKRAEVEKATGMGRSAIYARMNPGHKLYDPTFPRPVPIGGSSDSPSAVRWVASEVDAWIQARIEARDNRRAA
jgi:prophage regulatory protein